jgi:hypothetical protein
MAHGSHDTGRSRVESTLDHPALIRRDSDDRADVSVGNRVAELIYMEEGATSSANASTTRYIQPFFAGSKYTYVVDVRIGDLTVFTERLRDVQ